MNRTFLLAAALLAAGPALADEGASRDERFRKNLEAWQRMSPEEQATVKRRFEVWKKLPADERETITRGIARIETMPDEDREAIRLRLQRLSNLPPQERQRVEQRVERMKKTEGRRREVIQGVGELVHLLPPETRRALRAIEPERRKETIRQLAVLFAQMTPEERVRFAELPPDQRSRRLQALMAEHREKLERILDGIGPVIAAIPVRMATAGGVSSQLPGIQRAAFARMSNT